MSGQGLANLSAVTASCTLLMAIAATVLDRRTQARLEREIEFLKQRATKRGVTLTRVRRTVEEGVQLVELEGSDTTWGQGYLACANAILEELDTARANTRSHGTGHSA